jgi:hypothetical protein
LYIRVGRCEATIHAPQNVVVVVVRWVKAPPARGLALVEAVATVGNER